MLLHNRLEIIEILNTAATLQLLRMALRTNAEGEIETVSRKEIMAFHRAYFYPNIEATNPLPRAIANIL
jgi:hypothetical protein